MLNKFDYKKPNGEQYSLDSLGKAAENQKHEEESSQGLKRNTQDNFRKLKRGKKGKLPLGNFSA